MAKPYSLTEDQLDLLHHIHHSSNKSQRKIAKEIGFSIGKVNYCLRELLVIGYIKVGRFNKSDHKSRYSYILTQKGIREKTIITKQFLIKKKEEYDKLNSYINN